MELKRVSFETAKALKLAGYPQDYKNAEDTYTNLNGGIWVKPTYLEIWLWLWREKKIWIEVLNFSGSFLVYINKKPQSGVFKDPEDAIIATIEYIVSNDLIK